jgi:probable HAF family extracellular repeat protein
LGISGAGDVAGVTYDAAGQPRAAQWSAGSAAAPGPVNSSANAISHSGKAAGSAGGQAATFGAGTHDNLGIGTSWSVAYGINDSGVVAGTAQQADSTFAGFLLYPGAVPLWLTALGGSHSYGLAINAANTVAGSAQTAAGYLHAALWDSGAVMDLGTLGGVMSGAYGINDSGSVVGYSRDSAGVSRAFVFVGGILYDLNSLIDPAAGWMLEAAYAINGAGQIAGTGFFNGTPTAFRLDPLTAMEAAGAHPVPEPSTLILTTAALIVLLVWKPKVN